MRWKVGYNISREYMPNDGSELNGTPSRNIQCIKTMHKISGYSDRPYVTDWKSGNDTMQRHVRVWRCVSDAPRRFQSSIYSTEYGTDTMAPDNGCSYILLKRIN